jgi:vitamin-K-epoxide reductase (warfarin-sensitive)
MCPLQRLRLAVFSPLLGARVPSFKIGALVPRGSERNTSPKIKTVTIKTKNGEAMKYILLLLSVLGIAVSALALREHYRTEGDSPCSINERWDCGIVNHSPYAVLAGIPVAILGIVGYLLMGALAWHRAYGSVLAAALVGLAFSLYLARIEAHVLGVWCIYCVISLGDISLITLLSLVTTLAPPSRKSNQLS